MANGDTTTPATTPDRIESSSVRFDPKTIGDTVEEKLKFLYDQLFGNYSDTIKIPRDVTVEEFKNFLKRDWIFRIKSNPALANELNALTPIIIDRFGDELFRQIVWAGKTMIPDEDTGPRKHYEQGGQATEKGAVGTAADPVNLFNGNFSYSTQDVAIDGAGIEFAFTRSYSQQSVFNGPLGFKWDHNYNLWISVAADQQTLTLSEGDLQLHHFRRHELHDYFVPPDGKCAVVVATGNSFELREPNGDKIVFQPHDLFHPTIHVASRVEDKFGNHLRFRYSDGLLSRIEINRPDRTVSFFYDTLSRITAIRDFTGRVWRYAYDDLGDLVVVTTPPTNLYRRGLHTQYQYSSYSYGDTSAQHNLIAIIDADGRIYLENEYGTDRDVLSYNRVIRQRQGGGDMHFDYADVVEEFAFRYADHERPAHQTVVTDADGRQSRYLFNKSGNTVLMETYARLAGIPRIVSTHYRYNKDGNLIGIMSPMGVIKQYLFARDRYERSHPQEPDYTYARDTDLTASARLGFNNLLSVVERGKYYEVADLNLSGGLWSADIFPDIFAAAPEDIVHKFTYEDEFGQMTMSSDPRFTASPDPDFAEAQDYDLHLTRYAYALGNGHSHLTLASVTRPRARLPDGSEAPEVVTRFTEYDPNGRLLRTIGPGGLEIRNEYFTDQDGLRQGFPKGVTCDPGGLNIRFAMDCDLLGRATKHFRPKFFAVENDRFFNTVEFNELNQVIRITGTAPFSIEQRFAYNRTGNLHSSVTELKDGTNALTGLWEAVNRYNDQFHVVRQLQTNLATGDSRMSKAVFDRAGRPYISLAYSGYREKYSYNERGLKARAIADYGRVHAVTSLRYDADGRLVSRTDPNGNMTRYQYDAAGRLIDEEDAAGHRTIFHYDKAGNATLRLAFERRSNNEFLLVFRKEIKYDALNRPIVEGINKFQTAPAVAEAALHTSFTTGGPGELLTCEYYYSESGQLYQFRDFQGRLYRSEFDVLGRQIRSIDPTGNEIRLTYDSENNVTRIDRKEVTWNEDRTQVLMEQHFAQANRYDELNRVVEEINSLGNKVIFTYDSRGNLLRLEGPLNTVCENAYDPFDRLAIKTDHLHRHRPGEPPILLHTHFVYDNADQIVRRTDTLGRDTQFVYDSMGRLLSTILPDNSADHIRYDRCGNIVELHSRNNVVKRYRYDARHQPVECHVDSANIAAGDTIEGAFHYTSAYDGLGRAIRQENEFCRIESSYDSLGRNVLESATFRGIPNLPNPMVLSIAREFNDTNGLTGLRYPSGRQIAFGRDALDRMTDIRQLQKGNAYPGDAATPDSVSISDMRYEGLRKKGQSRSNGCDTRFSYDFGGRVMQVVHATAGATLLDCRYLYDALGNMRNKSEGTGAAAQLQYCAFDSLSRLYDIKAATAPAVDLSQLEPSAQPIAASIPDFQDRIDKRMAAADTVAGTQYDYDHMGNRLSVTSAIGSETYQPLPNDQYQVVNHQPLEYDSNGNLKEDPQFSYRYDHNSQLSRIVNKATGAVVQLFYDPLGRNCAQLSELGTRVLVHNGYRPIEEYLDGALISSAVFESEQDVPMLRSRDGKELFYCGDLSRSTRLVMDGSQLVASYHYDAFGIPLQPVTSADEFLFGGKRFVPGTAKYDFLFRTYDPATGRFIQRDPAGFVDGLNLYTYAGNNPVSYADPTGLERRELWLGKEIGADFGSPDIDIQDPNLGMDGLSVYYFTEGGTFLRWNEHTSSWVEDYTGVNVIIEKAPEPKKSFLQRYLNGWKRGLMAPVNLVKDTGAKVVDMATQGFAVIGKATGGWDTGYTTWSSTSKAVQAGVSQKELLWQATGGLVVNPIIAVGDIIFKQDPEALGEFVGGAMVGGTFKVMKGGGAGGGSIPRNSIDIVVPKGQKKVYRIDGKTYWIKRHPSAKSKITTDPHEVDMFKKSLADQWEYASYSPGTGQRRRTVTSYSPNRVDVPPGASDVIHTHPVSGIGLPSVGDIKAVRAGTTESVLGRAFPNADAFLRSEGLPESGLVIKTTYGN